MEDADFEVTAEMLIHDDVDDESTLDEEEALDERDDEEIDELQKESEMPLEELLARYGYGVPAEGNEEEEEEESEDEEQDTKEPPPQAGQTSSQAGQTSSQAGQTSQTSSNPSQTRSQQSPHPTRPEDQAVVKDSPSPSSPHSSLDLLAHETTEDLELSEGEAGEEEEEEGEMARSPSPADAADTLSVLGKHPRSDDDHSHGPVHKDIMLSSLATDKDNEHISTTSDSTHSGSAHSSSSPDRLSPPPSTALTSFTDHSITTRTTVTTSTTLTASPGTSTMAEPSEPSTSAAAMAGPSSFSGRTEHHPERRSIRLMAAGERLALEGYFTSLFEDENSDESDEEYVPRDLLWRKEVKVGSNYQARVPEIRKKPSNNSAANSSHAHSSTPSSSVSSNSTNCSRHDNSSTYPVGELVWSPKGTSEAEVVEYLECISEQVTGMDSSGERDNEQALEVLQKCNHDVPKALDYVHKKGLSTGMKPWTEEECKNFEEGLQSLGKDFFNIQRKIPTRTVKEVVEFYYVWKKTERYDAFVQQYGKIGRKRIVYPPGHMSDFMERYLDLFATDSPDLQYATSTVYAEMKRDT